MSDKNIVYIAHPIGGNVLANLMKVAAIVRTVNMNSESVVPFVPYFADCVALDDGNPAERKRGIENGLAVLTSGCVDEVWLYGDGISEGMRSEIEVARRNGIPVRPKTPQTKAAYHHPKPTLK